MPGSAGVAGVSDVARVFAGYQQSCAVRRDQSLWCWGANDAGQIGDGGLTERVTTPRRGRPLRRRRGGSARYFDSMLTNALVTSGAWSISPRSWS